MENAAGADTTADVEAAGIVTDADRSSGLLGNFLLLTSALVNPREAPVNSRQALMVYMHLFYEGRLSNRTS